jgi:hypothetical protein
MAYQKGDVVLVPFPFADVRAAKARPALVRHKPGTVMATDLSRVDAHLKQVLRL